MIYTILFILSIAILLLSISIFFFLNKNIYLTKSDKDFIEFVIDMYIKYGEELDINSKKQHDTIVKQLEKLKSKIHKKRGD